MTLRMRLQPDAIGTGMTSQRVRDRLVERLRENGIRDERVLNAIRTVPRHLFVDEALATRAYEDTALPIGHGQTISQPWVVAKMTEALLEAAAPAKVLEIGTGSGYQAAVLAALGLEVHTVERIGELLRTARKRFRTAGHEHPQQARRRPHRLARERPVRRDHRHRRRAGAGGGADRHSSRRAARWSRRSVAPSSQSLLKLRKDADGVITQQSLAPVVFVPLLSGMID